MGDWKELKKSLGEYMYEISSKIHEIASTTWDDDDELDMYVEKFHDDLFATLTSSTACVPITTIHDKLNSLRASCNMLVSGDPDADTDVCYELMRTVGEIVDNEYKHECGCMIQNIEVL